MVRPLPKQVGAQFSSAILAVALFVSAAFLVALCAKHARQARRKYKSPARDSKIAPKSPSPLRSAAPPMDNHGEEPKIEEGFGEVGLWQKAILMGEKCQPPEFSGALFYDSCGNRVSEFPKSPRAIHERGFFTFPV